MATIPMTNSQSTAGSGPQSQPPITNPAFRTFLSRLTSSIRQGFSQRRPWFELIDRTAMARPDNLTDAYSRTHDQDPANSGFLSFLGNAASSAAIAAAPAVASTTSKQGQTTTRSGLKGTSPPVGVDVESGENGGKLVHFDGPMVFGADDLLCATAEIMGKSTYGTVYKATLEDGSQVAVKRLREKIMKTPREFENEVTALGKIRHPNLLALRAYYLGPKGEKLLVFDYMPKGSLSTFLHGK
ncbi:hypothetical protein GOBAR_DD27039 [Gossypium barbadense]|nr:hypothetical protein GOBAR_DD27039 [Gossypium barbadense]